MSGTKIEMDKGPSMTYPSSEVSDDTLTVEVQERIIDNPGGGDCGFYAFAIGLIDIIQKEHALTGTSKTYDQWKIQSRYHISFQEILGIDLNELYHSRGNYRKELQELLFKLQMSLRTIACNIYKDEPINRIITEAVLKDGRANIEATPIFCKFMELVDFFLGKGDSLAKISQFNELAFSREVQELAIETAQSLVPLITDKSEKEAKRIQNTHVKEALLKDVVVDRKANPDSVILKGVEKIKEKGRWATHYDLKEIADQLHVNLHVVGKVNGRDKPSYPVITLYNESNIHWTTKATIVKKMSKALAKPTKLLEVSSLPGLSSKKIIELETEPKPLKKDTVTKKSPIQDQNFQKTEVGTQKKTQPQVMKRQPQYSIYNQTLFNHSDEIPLTSMSSKEDQKELNRLIHIVHRAVIAYCTYSDGIIFSLFHRHGASGRTRASKFDEQLSLVEDLEQAKNMLMDFLEDSKNGNTHPHSFRTMLLQGLLAANDPHHKKDLKYVSKNYSVLLEEFQEELIPDELVISL
ncbi:MULTISPECIES: hypothetical protein [Legionella]|uniref:Dot/Icm T4SS effector n=1 Tax=Legionella resiliens TaxID=2905958 RepID=A0ABS8X036_9GAMM|nr:MULTISPECIES: hypothetical protein [unclassified Legionella]MCE0722965.1 hypothetical protein [Legionella sp. 9fVS26]MCE3532118.1 hypothetical protein [Legionella sp. 8cVS16]QLZ68246.1 hypothetical protein FOLKNPGA_01024 [Legionella sp. PC1000]